MKRFMDFRGTIIIKKEDDWFVASCVENNVASQGQTIEEARANLEEAIALYYEDEPPIFTQMGQVYVTSLEMKIPVYPTGTNG